MAYLARGCMHGSRRPVVARAAPIGVPEVSQRTSLRVQFDSIYRVVLVYNLWLNDKHVAHKIRGSIPVVSFTDGLNVARRARVEGRAIVVTVPQEEAAVYADRLKKKGLVADLEEA